MLNAECAANPATMDSNETLATNTEPLHRTQAGSASSTVHHEMNKILKRKKIF